MAYLWMTSFLSQSRNLSGLIDQIISLIPQETPHSVQKQEIVTHPACPKYRSNLGENCCQKKETPYANAVKGNMQSRTPDQWGAWW